MGKFCRRYREKNENKCIKEYFLFSIALRFRNFSVIKPFNFREILSGSVLYSRRFLTKTNKIPKWGERWLSGFARKSSAFKIGLFFWESMENLRTIFFLQMIGKTISYLFCGFFYVVSRILS